MTPEGLCLDGGVGGSSRDMRNNRSRRESPPVIAAVAMVFVSGVDLAAVIEVFLAAMAERRAARVVSKDFKKTERKPSRESLSFLGGAGADGGGSRLVRDLYHSLKLLVGVCLVRKNGD